MKVAPTLAALGAGVLLAGCGGSGHKSGTSTTTSTTTSTSSSSSAQLTSAQALALARALNLQPADVAGFRATPSSPHESAAERALARQLEACAGAVGERHRLAEAKSDEFKRAANGLPQEVSSSVSVESAPAYAEQDLRAIRSARGQRCIVKFVDAALKGRKLSGAHVGAASIKEGTPPAAGASGAFGIRIDLPISIQQLTVHAYFDLLGFIRGPVEVTLQSIGVNEPFPAATQEHLFGVLVRRAAAHPV
jgi:hypothetical protein